VANDATCPPIMQFFPIFVEPATPVLCSDHGVFHRFQRYGYLDKIIQLYAFTDDGGTKGGPVNCSMEPIST